MKVVTTEEMRHLEEACAGIGLTSAALMENAGRAVAEQVQATLTPLDDEHILVLAGPGNNGADGLVAARCLREMGATVSVGLFGRRSETDANLLLARERDIPCMEIGGDEGLLRLQETLAEATAVIDAMFGTGLGSRRRRPLGGAHRGALEAIRSARREHPYLRVFALDLPSGLNADTGEADPACLRANDTITLGFPKQGLFNGPGAELAGRITIVDIGIPEDMADYVSTELMTAGLAASLLPERPLTANKGTFGRVLAIAGSPRYTGAAFLACAGAMRVGAGLVTLATPTSLQPVLAAKLTEATYLPLPETEPGLLSPEAAAVIGRESRDYTAMLVGCGLSRAAPVADLVRTVALERGPDVPPLVLDADALNILADIPDWWRQLSPGAILTPHPGEMSRLAGSTIGDVQSDRIGAARSMARAWRQTVVLKGAYTVVAAPEGLCRISPMANPGLASAGTGDVLAGVIAGLRAQGLSDVDAATCGTFLHGEAAEAVAARLGNTGMIAGDLLPELPRTIKKLREEVGEDGL